MKVETLFYQVLSEKMPKVAVGRFLRFFPSTVRASNNPQKKFCFKFCAEPLFYGNYLSGNEVLLLNVAQLSN